MSSDIAIEILKRRPIYIVLDKTSIPHAGSHNTILAIHFSYKMALLNMLKVAFSSMKHILHHYNPAYRFYQRRNEIVDIWQRSKGIDQYAIEEWYPHQNVPHQTQAHPTKTMYFHFDMAFKNMIIRDAMSIDMVQSKLKTWQTCIQNGTVPEDLMAMMDEQHPVRKRLAFRDNKQPILISNT